MNKLELRMFGLVNYQLNGRQIGIQFGHSVTRYGRKYNTENYIDWADNYETVIILNGGTTNNNPERLGTLNKHLQTLKDNDIVCQDFYEPDLGDQLTAVCFLVDERVFNKEKYPDFIDWVSSKFPFMREIYKLKYSGDISTDHNYIKWLDIIGGSKNLFLREFLENFELA